MATLSVILMFSDPEKIISQLEIHDNMFVADLGAGSGAYSFAIAERLKNKEGKIYALEVQKDLVARIKTEASARHLTNIEILWADIEQSGGTKLRDNSIDLAIVANVMFQVEDKMGLIEETRRIVKPGGMVLVVDWTDSYSNMGPHKDMVVSEQNAKELFMKKGFVVEKNIPAGSHHYGIVFKKA
jgi:ubiquinone/menaquinone biosynthesis C-methylase UbiE